MDTAAELDDATTDHVPAAADDVTVVLVHGAWADGSSWAKVITALQADGVRVRTAPLPLTSLRDDVAALDRALDRVPGSVILAGHAYAGAVIGSTRAAQVRALVYVAALAPDDGETVGDVFHRDEPHPKAPALAPDPHGLIWLPDDAAAAYGAERWNAYVDALPPAQREALHDYSLEPGPGTPEVPTYRDINAALRGTGPDSPEIGAYVAEIGRRSRDGPSTSPSW